MFSFLPKKALTISLFCLTALPLSSLASTTSGQQTVQASVINSCVITSSDALNFGTSFDPTQATSNPIIRQIVLRCTQNASGWIGISQGANPASGSTCDNPIRQLVSTTGVFLQYNLTYDSSSTNWGCSQTSGRAFTSTSVGTDINVQAVGVIPSGQDVPAGDYTDELTITVNF